jgi:hypothetical protein
MESTNRGAFIYEAQCVDPDTGQENWVQVEGSSPEDAKEQAIAAGAVVGAVRLKEIKARPQVPASPKEKPVRDRSLCPECKDTKMIPPGRGMHGAEEVMSVAFLVLIGIIPGVLYYLYLEIRPWCPKCRKRQFTHTAA